MIPYQQRIPGSDAVIEMVPVPGGRIRLDPVSPSLGKTQTMPIDPFWIGKFEMTMQQYLPYRQLYYTQKRNERKKTNQVATPTEVDAVTAPTEPTTRVIEPITPK